MAKSGVGQDRGERELNQLNGCLVATRDTSKAEAPEILEGQQTYSGSSSINLSLSLSLE